MTYVFPDTNVFVHFQPIEKWNKTDIVADDFQVALSPSVISELDKIKYSAGSAATKRRVQETVKRLSESTNMLFDNLQFVFIDDPNPFDEFLRSHNLSSTDKDDHFLATVKFFKESHPLDGVIVLTNDLGVKLKCKRHGIEFISPESKYGVVEPDESSKEIKKLLSQLDRLQNLQPVVKMCFPGGEQRQIFDLEEPWDDYEYIVKEKMEEIRASNPHIKAEPTPDNEWMVALQLYRKTPEKVKKYNDALDEFYKKYELYLKRSEGMNYKKALTIQLELEIMNFGTNPAEDVDIYMHFPDGFTLLTKDQYYSGEMPPSPPELQYYSLAPIDTQSMLSSIIGSSFPRINTDRFSIKKTNSYDVDENYEYIKHNATYSFRKLYVMFDSFEDAKSFEITYTMTAGNMVEKTNGSLQVILNKIDRDEVERKLLETQD